MVSGAEIFAVTDEDGNYSFEDMPPRETPYIVREVQQDGWFAISAPPPVTLTPGARITGINFRNSQSPLRQSIEGTKYNDLDADGERQPGENGLEGWTIFIDGNNNGVLDMAAVPLPTVHSTDVGQAITDFGTMNSTLEFSGGATSINDVNIELDITHSFDGDLDVYLVSPAGTQIELFTGIGGEGDNFTGTILDDQASMSITDAAASPPFNGTFRAEELLAGLNGENPNGIWTLVVARHRGRRHGCSQQLVADRERQRAIHDHRRKRRIHHSRNWAGRHVHRSRSAAAGLGADFPVG